MWPNSCSQGKMSESSDRFSGKPATPGWRSWMCQFPACSRGRLNLDCWSGRRPIISRLSTVSPLAPQILQIPSKSLHQSTDFANVSCFSVPLSSSGISYITEFSIKSKNPWSSSSSFPSLQTEPKHMNSTISRFWLGSALLNLECVLESGSKRRIVRPNSTI